LPDETAKSKRTMIDRGPVRAAIALAFLGFATAAIARSPAPWAIAAMALAAAVVFGLVGKGR
jgi:hypothetical protein